MIRTKARVLGVIVALLLPLLAPLDSAVAQTAGSCTLSIRLPDRMVIRQNYQPYVTHLNGCTHADDLSAGVYLYNTHHVSVDYLAYFGASRNDRRESSELETKPGTYHTVLDDDYAYDRNYNEYDVSFRRTSFVARYNSYVHLKASRRHAVVTMTVATKRFVPSANYGSGGMVHRGAKVVVQRRDSHGRWRHFHGETTDRQGIRTFSFRAGKRHSYRARYLQTATVWEGDTAALRI